MARQRGVTFQADVLLKSGRKRPQGFATMAEAELWEAQAKLNDEQGRPQPPLPSPQAARASAAGVTLDEVRRLCLKTAYSRNRKGGWFGSKDYRTAEARSQFAVDFFGEDMLVSAITLSELERYATACRTAGNRPATINRKIAAVSKLLSFAAQRGMLAALPATPHDDGEKDNARTRVMTHEEEERGLAMLEIMGLHDFRQLTILLVETGARVSEILKLEATDYRLTGADPRVVFRVTKGGEARDIPLTPRAIAALKYFDDRRDGAVMPFAHIPYWEYRFAWERARKRLGASFADLTIHVFRHTCLTRLVDERKASAWDVKLWAGHANVKTSERYVHQKSDALRRLISIIEPEAPKPTDNVVPLRRSA